MKEKYGIKDILLIIVGNLLLSIGVAFFIVPNNILSGGVAGIAVAIAPVIHVSSTMLINVLTMLFFFVGALILGKHFALKTLFSSFLYPFFISIFEGFAKQIEITNDPVLASIYGGIFIGLGVGIVYRTGASTGGMDIPPLIIHKYTGVSLATLVAITDSFTVLLGMSIHGIEPALVGLLSVFTSSYMINKAMMLGIADAKSLMIISDKYEELLHEITTMMDRGATILHAEGGFTRENRPVLMIVILKKQFPAINRMITQIDPAAFVIIHDVNEVQGEGFTFDYEWKKGEQ